MLILFDIDMTLLRTGRGGLRAITEAGLDAFGRELDFDGVATAGRLDPVILADLLEANGIDPTPDNIAAIRRGYAERAGAIFAERTQALPGAAALVRFVAEHERLVAGLLTGNFEETGLLKLQAAGFDPNDFPVQTWGDDSPHDPPLREHLPPVAIDRYREHTGSPVDAADVTIIGDTPHDVACGLAHGCRVLAVATGYSPREDLEAAGAHRVVDSLEDTEGISRWLMQR